MSTSMKYDDMMKKLDAVAPALSTSSILAILTHIWFVNKKYVMAFNDEIALRTELKTEFEGAVPGRLLIDLLKASPSDQIEITTNENSVTVKSDKVKLKIGLLPPSTFIFDMPRSGRASIEADEIEKFINALEFCNLSLRDDVSQPDQMGVTIIPEKGTLYFYSTDTTTISSVILQIQHTLKERVIVPRQFCQQAIALRKEVEHIEINQEFALLKTKDVTLYGRIVVSDDPWNFEEVINRNYTNEDKLIKVPTELIPILTRAMIVADNQHPMQVKSEKENSLMTFYSKSGNASVKDTLRIKHPDVQMSLDPRLIRNGLALTRDNKPVLSSWIMKASCCIMADETNLYIIAAAED